MMALKSKNSWQEGLLDMLGVGILGMFIGHSRVMTRTEAGRKEKRKPQNWNSGTAVQASSLFTVPAQT
jgi:hypothetical protein